MMARAIVTTLMRDGVFHGPVFLHPALRFQYRFPLGWRAGATRDEVVGLSPAHDAVIRLRLVDGTPWEAVQALAEGLDAQVGLLDESVIDGLAVLACEFSWDPGDGPVRGIVHFFEYGGRTYQATATAIGHSFSRRAGALRRSVASFQRLSLFGSATPPP